MPKLKYDGDKFIEYKIGDCLDLMKDMDDNSVDLVLTDPPYGINVVGGSKPFGSVGGSKPFGSVSGSNIVKVNKYHKMINDDKPLDKIYFQEMFRISKSQIIFGGNYYNLPVKKGWIVWDKKMKNDWNDNFSDGELVWTSFDRPLKIFRHKYMGLIQEGKRDIRVHPTQKPVPLFMWILENYSKPDDLICDPFLGSGTTLKACQLTGRNGIGFEIAKEYESVIRKRCSIAKSKSGKLYVRETKKLC